MVKHSPFLLLYVTTVGDHGVRGGGVYKPHALLAAVTRLAPQFKASNSQTARTLPYGVSCWIAIYFNLEPSLRLPLLSRREHCMVRCGSPPDAFFNTWSTVVCFTQGRNQQDSHELLHALLDGIQVQGACIHYASLSCFVTVCKERPSNLCAACCMLHAQQCLHATFHCNVPQSHKCITHTACQYAHSHHIRYNTFMQTEEERVAQYSRRASMEASSSPAVGARSASPASSSYLGSTPPRTGANCQEPRDAPSGPEEAPRTPAGADSTGASPATSSALRPVPGAGAGADALGAAQADGAMPGAAATPVTPSPKKSPMNIAPPESGVVQRTFGGQLASMIRCCECSYSVVSERVGMWVALAPGVWHLCYNTGSMVTRPDSNASHDGLYILARCQ